MATAKPRVLIADKMSPSATEVFKNRGVVIMMGLLCGHPRVLTLKSLRRLKT